MRNPFPWFPLYVHDSHAAAAHLSLAEDGALNRLWRILWISPGLSIPDDKAWIMRKMRADNEEYERVIQPVIDEFLELRGSRLHSPRLSEIHTEQSERHKKRSVAGKKGAEAKHLKSVNSDRGPA